LEKTRTTFGNGRRLRDPYVVTVKGKIVIVRMVLVLFFVFGVGVGTRARRRE
jgi:hypothetical protein